MVGLSATRMPSASSLCSIPSGQDHPLFLFSIQICYMSVRLFSKAFIQFGFLWRKNNNDSIQSILRSSPSSGAVLKSTPTLSRMYSLRSGSRLFNSKHNLCPSEKPISVSQVPREAPSLPGSLKLLTIDLFLGENTVTVSGAIV